MATEILQLPEDFVAAPTWSAPIAETVTGALDTQAMAWIRTITAKYPDGVVLEIPDDTSWAVSNAGVISPGAGVAAHATRVGAFLQTSTNYTVDEDTAGWEASASGLYLFAVIGADSWKTGEPVFALSDSATYTNGILIASGITTDTDSITAATDARELSDGIGGDGSVPTGTGIPHIVGGVQNAAASLIVNADVHASAAIAESKIAFTDDAAAGTASRRTLGTGAQQAAAGNHTHTNATTTTAGFHSAADKLKLDNATDAATASTLAMRDSSGRLKVAAPSAGGDAANKTYVDAQVSAGAADASTTTKGIAKMSVAPASPTEPIAVGTNDPRVDDFGVAGGSHSQGLVPDPGATTHSPVYVLREDGWGPAPGNAIDGSGAAGRLAYWTDTDSLSGEANLSWDATNDRLGIGTDAPDFQFEQVSESGDVQHAITAYGTGNTPAFIGRKARGTKASPTAVQSGDTIFGLGGRGYGATGWVAESKARIFKKAAENWTDAANGTLIEFWTTALTTTVVRAVAKILPTGVFQLLVGHLELPEISTPTTPASGFGAIYFKSDGKPYALNDAGTETDLTAAGGGGGSATLNAQTALFSQVFS